MKTADIVRHFRNATSPAARLARWQARRAPARLADLRALPSYAGETLAARRAYALANYDTGPELSSPDAETPFLWTNEGSPLVRRFWRGREFLRHRGWYTDDEHETLEAYAVQLEAFPRLIFEAVRESINDSLRIYLAEGWEIEPGDNLHHYHHNARETARDVIHSADGIARREAEEEREHQAKEYRKRQAEEARDELAQNRDAIRTLISDLRRLCPSDLPTTYPAAAQAVRDQFAALLKERRDTLDSIRNLTA